MKKWFVLAVMMGVIAGVQAKEMTKEQFVAAQKKRVEALGKEFNQANAEATFEKKDLNKDGVLSDEEQKPAPKKAPAAK